MITPEMIYEKTKTLDKTTLQEVADFNEVNSMITPEMIYEKTKTLDKTTLQEVADFVDFLTHKRSLQKQYEEMRKYFPAGELEPADKKPSFTTKRLTLEEMDAAVVYEADLYNE